MSSFDTVFRAMGVSRSALEAQRLRIEIAAGNIAHSDVDSRAATGPYRARRVRFESLIDDPERGDVGGVRVAGIDTDPTPGQRVLAPPGTTRGVDADGMIEKSNVKVSREMVDLLEASRSYEANIAALRTYREMFMRALTLGA